MSWRPPAFSVLLSWISIGDTAKAGAAFKAMTDAATKETLCVIFFFNFWVGRGERSDWVKRKRQISGEWKRPRDDANATQNSNRTTVKRERASLLFESTRTFSFSSSRVGVLVADRCAIEIKRAKIPSEIFVFWTYLLGEFVGRLDADDNLLGLLGGRFDRNQVGGERWS